MGLVAYAADIGVERSGSEPPCSLWLWLRGQDLDPSSEADLHLLVDALKGQWLRFSLPLHRLGPRFELRQDITAAVQAHADDVPPALPLLSEHLASGLLFIWVDGRWRMPAAQAHSRFEQALRWCAPDYSDVLAELQDQLESSP